MERRAFLRVMAGLAAAGILPRSPWGGAMAVAADGPYGPLGPADANGIMLPAGFTSREVARGGSVVGTTGYVWPPFPDGGAVFRAPGGWIYVANSERNAPAGGVSALRFARDGSVVDAYAICTGTGRNCAGGATRWRTWLSCEETVSGNVWECDPRGVDAAVRRSALGTFQHEAVALSPRERRLYLTEDVPNGCLYRFTPTRWRDLSAGTLEVAIVSGQDVSWAVVPNPNPVIGVDTPTRLQVPGSTAFNGGEGITCRRNHVYFTTKGDNRVWDLDTVNDRLTVFYDAALDPTMQLTGVDNVTHGRSGDLFVAEDGGNMELVMLTPDGVVAPLLRVVGQDGSELAGPAFDPTGRRLYVSSQRGGGSGITYEISGPFRRRMS